MKHYLDLEKAVGDVDLRPAVYIGDSMTQGMKGSIKKYYAARGVPVLVLDRKGSSSSGWHEVFTSKRPKGSWKRRAKSQYDAFMAKHPNAQFNVGSLGGNAWPTASKGSQALTDYSNKYTRFLFQKVKDTGGIVGGTTTSGARGPRFKSRHTGTDSHDDLKGLVNTQYSKLAKEMGVPYYDARSAEGADAWRPPKGAVHPKWGDYKKMAASRMRGQQSLSNQAYSAPMSTADARSSTAKIEAPTQSLASPKDLRPPAPAVASRPAPTKPAAPTRPTTPPQRSVTTLRSDLITSKPKQEAVRSMPVRKSLWMDGDIYKGRRKKSGLKVDPELQVKIEKLADKYSKKTGVPAHVILDHIWVESRMKPKAVSKTGARGLMQIMPSVQKQYGVTDPHDLEQNIRAGSYLLRDLKKRVDKDPLITSNKWKAVSMMYFAGATGAGKRIAKYHPNVLQQSKTQAREKKRIKDLDSASEELGLPKPSEVAPSKPIQDDWHRRMAADVKEKPTYKDSKTGKTKKRATTNIFGYGEAVHNKDGIASKRPKRLHFEKAPMSTSDARSSRGAFEAKKQSLASYADLAPRSAGMSTSDARSSSAAAEAPAPKYQTRARPTAVVSRPTPVRKSLFQTEYFIEE